MPSILPESFSATHRSSEWSWAIGTMYCEPRDPESVCPRMQTWDISPGTGKEAPKSKGAEEQTTGALPVPE